MAQPSPDSVEAAHRLPRLTTPTWEVELLISGVAVFAMLQLPGLLDDAVFALRPRFDARGGELVWLCYVYTKSAALILAATFVLHLLLRAQWIALVGLHSIQPGGIDWNRLGLGPRAQEIEAGRLADIPQVIERADNRATTVFALGVMLAPILLGVALVVAVGTGLVTLAASMLDTQVETSWVAMAVAAAMLPFGLAHALDRRVGRRRPGSVLDRVLRGVIAGYARCGLGMARNPGFALLSSQHGRRPVVTLLMVVLMGALGTVIVGYYAMRNPGTFGSYTLFPESGADGPAAVDAAYYDDRRNPARDPLVPFIQSAVVATPYLQLVVPYDPRRDDAALRTGCPEAARAGGLLGCLQRLRAVTLDGQPVAGLQYRPGSDARTDRPALVAMIDVRGLARGVHELAIARSPDASAKADAAEPDRIVFWR